MDPAAVAGALVTYIKEITASIDALQANVVVLSEVRRQAIQQLYDGGGWTYRDLAKEFGISYARIGQILNKPR